MCKLGLHGDTAGFVLGKRGWCEVWMDRYSKLELIDLSNV